ncbi:MAG: hypothetical protein HOK97_15650 [Deltaproteobacteria bacterium]|jgi:hypothetical protein|nr:hypothetical protein [Deltaproteobacteria bacterium]MBT6491206.1 hypothetical protein [Deltaproteobacteria bacterium]
MKTKKLLIQFVGTPNRLSLFNKLHDEFDVTVLTNSQTTSHIADPTKVYQKVDYGTNSHTELVKTLGPFDTVLIVPSISLEKSDTRCNRNIRGLLNQTFLALKGLYRPLMRARSGSVWILNSEIGHSILAPSNPLVIESTLNAGLEALAKVAGMELARKKVAVNYLGICNTIDPTDLSGLLSWSHINNNFFVTAQGIETGLRKAS